MSTVVPMLPEEARAALRSKPRRARGRWRLFFRTPGRVIGVVIIAFFALMAIVGPYLYPQNLPINPNDIYASPSLAHPLGTDFEGTDVLALIVTGARYVMLSAVIAAIVTIVLGTGIGLVAGYYRGPTDSILMRLTDLILTIPGFPLLIVLATIWDFGSPYQMGLVLGIFGWGGLARAVRSQTLSLRQRGFLEAARGLGLSGRHIIWHELLPNIAPYVAMNLLLSVTGAIYAEVGLFFLGVVPFNAANWGVMLNNAVFDAGAVTSTRALTYLLAPLVCILLLTLAIVLVLNAVDEWFNPRLRSVAVVPGRRAPTALGAIRGTPLSTELWVDADGLAPGSAAQDEED
jgi:peptide/nickel transport system permease protein